MKLLSETFYHSVPKRKEPESIPPLKESPVLHNLNVSTASPLLKIIIIIHAHAVGAVVVCFRVCM